MPELIPVDFNPFDPVQTTEPAQQAAPKLVPVDFNPFQQQAPATQQAPAVQQPPAQQFPLDPSVVQAGLQQQQARPQTFRQVSGTVSEEEQERQRIEQLPELGAIIGGYSPEEQTSAASIAFGLLTTSNPKEQIEIIKKNAPELEISESQGNFLLKDPQGNEYVLNKPGVSGQDIRTFAAQAGLFAGVGKLATLPIKLSGKVFAGGAGAGLTQGAIEGIQSQIGGELNQGEIALATGLGGAVEVVAPIISAVRAARSGTISAADQEVLDAAEKLNIPIKTTDIIPPTGKVGGLARQLGETVPFGTGAGRGAQEESRQAAIINIAEDYPAINENQIAESLLQGANKFKKAAASRMNETASRLDPVGAVPITETLKAVDDKIALLSRPGKVQDKTTISKLEEFKNTLTEAPQDFSLLRENRTAVREAAESALPAARSQLPTQSAAAIKSIQNSITKDLDNFVSREEGAKGLFKYKQADQVYRREAGLLTKSKLKNALDKAEITPEVAEKMILSKNVSEVRALYKSLTTEGRSAGRAALFNRAIEKAGGIDNFSATRFGNELKRLKKNTGIFFRGEQREKIEGLQKVLEMTKRAKDAGAITPTGQSLTGLAGLGAGVQIGGLNSLILGGSIASMARAYESKAVRDILLKIKNSTPTEAQKIFDEKILTSLRAAAQAGRGGS